MKKLNKKLLNKMLIKTQKIALFAIKRLFVDYLSQPKQLIKMLLIKYLIKD